LNGQAKIVLDYLAGHECVSESELQELLGVKRTRAYTLAKQMTDAGMITIAGRGASKRYILTAQ
jgi:ATP-dependent DNA helicase RecG